MKSKNFGPLMGRRSTKTDAPKEAPKVKKSANSLSDGENASPEPQLDNVRKWLKTVRFKKSFIGGVDEADVWKKISELNSLYEAALAAERVRYDALLKERVTLAARYMARQYGPMPESSDGTENVSEEA